MTASSDAGTVPGRLYNVPSLPRHYLARTETLEALKSLVLGGARAVGITAPSAKVGVQGMGGIGKSILAAALARDQEVREAFPDGVVWVTLGQNPDLLLVQAEVAAYFDDDVPDFLTTQQGKGRLSKVLVDKACLLILDDVWRVRHAAAFAVLGPEGRLLISTRHRAVIDGIDAETLPLDLLDEEQSLELLRQSSRTPPGEPLPEEAAEVAKECGHLPLALAMIGAMVRDKPRDRWALALRRLRGAELEKIRSRFADYPHPNLFKALHVSVEALPRELQERYLDLAVFPEDFSVPEAVFETYWATEDLGGLEPVEVLDLFIDGSLAYRGYLNGIRLHDLQHDYVRRRTVDMVGLHNRFLEGYSRKYPGGWATCPDHGYLFRFLVHHLEQAGRSSESEEAARALLAVPGLHPAASINCLRSLGEKAVGEAKNLLLERKTHSGVVCWCLKLLGREEAKSHARRLLLKSTDYQVLCRCLGLLGEEAKPKARRLLLESKHPYVLGQCLGILGEEAKPDARRLLQESKHPYVLGWCLHILGEEAKPDARRLLEESKDKGVLCRCLDVLGEEAKPDARRLLQESKAPDVHCRCLDLLGEEAKPDARRLLRESKHFEVLCRCLGMLGEEAKPDARRLLKESKAPSVLCRCLDLLGEEARPDARRLLKESKNPDVLGRCLDLLGEEAKPEARRLLQESKDKEVLCRCLDLLDEEAKPDARRLILESKVPEVLCRCLDLLDEEAKPDARRLIQESKDKEVLCRCLDLLGEEAKPDARHLLLEKKDKEVLCRCLDLLGEEASAFATEQLRSWKQSSPYLLVRCFQIAGSTPEASQAATEMLEQWNRWVPSPLRAAALRARVDHPLRAQRATEVLSSWHKQYRPLVAAALVARQDQPEDVTEICRAILRRWHPEIGYQIKKRLNRYEGHIWKALLHPDLRRQAIMVTQEMLATEARQPGFLGPMLLEVAQGIQEGEWPPWA